MSTQTVHSVPELAGCRGTIVAAWAGDLHERPGLLRAWAREFDAYDDVTLVVLGDGTDLELILLEQAAARAGLVGDDAADVLGMPLPDAHSVHAVIANATALLSAAPGAEQFGLPVLDELALRERVSALAAGETDPERPRPSRDPAAWLAGRPWLDLDLPPRVTAAPSMLLPTEQSLLFRLMRDFWRPGGRVIDAGCFMGGSTVALAAGLKARGAEPAGQIDVYDLFVMDEVYLRSSPHLSQGLAAGESFRFVFDAALGEELLPYVTVHEGDLHQERWDGGRIDVLHYDVGKIWSLNDHVAREFFPALVPGRSVLVQQDYIHEWLPWLHITMDLFADRFRLLDFVPQTGSTVFLCTAAIHADEVPADLRASMPAAEKIERFDRAISPFRGVERGVLEVARAVLLNETGDPEAARRQLEATVARYGASARVTAGAELLRERLP